MVTSKRCLHTNTTNKRFLYIKKYFSGNPVELQVDSGNGNISAISDTRLQAGGRSSTNSSFNSEASTAEL